VQSAGPDANQVRSYVGAFPIFSGVAQRGMLVQFDSLLSGSPGNQYSGVWRALIALELGEPARAQQIVRTLVARPDTLQRYIHGSLVGIDGLATVAQGDTARGMAIADSGLRLIGGINVTAFTAPVQLRYAMLQVARPASRSRGIQRLRYGFELSPELHPMLQLYLGRAYETAAKPDSAALAYSRFLRLWDGADSVYRPILAEARAGLARVSGEAADGAPVGEETP